MQEAAGGAPRRGLRGGSSGEAEAEDREGAKKTPRLRGCVEGDVALADDDEELPAPRDRRLVRSDDEVPGGLCEASASPPVARAAPLLVHLPVAALRRRQRRRCEGRGRLVRRGGRRKLPQERGLQAPGQEDHELQEESPSGAVEFCGEEHEKRPDFKMMCVDCLKCLQHVLRIT